MPPYFAITGMPRSGTTYLSAVLYHPPALVTLSESGGQWKQLYKAHGGDADPIPVFNHYYQKIQAGEDVSSLEGTSGLAGEGRVDTWNQKKVSQTIPVNTDFTLGMKNPEVFLEWLPSFCERGYKCLISIRHPIGVINSWASRSVRRQKKGKTIAGTFANGDAITFSATASEPNQRRIELYNYFAKKILSMRTDPQVMVVRYEDWFDEPESLLDQIVEFLDITHPNMLRPRPIPPDPITFLSEDEQTTILKHCTIASEFGYSTQVNALASIALATTPPIISQDA